MFYPSQPKLYAKISNIAPIKTARTIIALSSFCFGVSSFRDEQSLDMSEFASNSYSFNLPFNNSSKEIPKTSAKTSKLNISGLPKPDSHFEIVLFESSNLSANCCCVNLFFSQFSNQLSGLYIIHYSFSKSRVTYFFLTGCLMPVFHFSGATFLASDI